MYNDRISKFDIAVKLFKQKNLIESERILLQILENNRQDKYALFQMGKIKVALKDLKGAEQYFEECLRYFPHNKYPILELGKLYARQGKEKEAQKMYEYILKNIDNEIYDAQSRIQHIQKHMKNDLNKQIHGVWKKNCIEILEKAIKNKGQKQIGYMCDIYCIYVPDCGYEGATKEMVIL